MMSVLLKSFLHGVKSVQPQNLIPRYVTRQNDILHINGKRYVLRNVYIIGFGKAVGGMVHALETILKKSDNGDSFIQQGIISVPYGYLQFAECNGILPSHPCIKMREGAKDNFPDMASQSTTEEILKLIKTLNEDDLLIVLISGGGSALLSYPEPPLTLNEKVDLIRMLSLKGASISEINTIRRVISAVKGGKLAQHTKAQVVSLILSDIIGNPLSLIASGPTVTNKNEFGTPETVLQKYNIPMSNNVQTVIEKHKSSGQCMQDFVHVRNVIIGDNKIALHNISDYIKENTYFNCIPVIMSSSLQGEAAFIGKELVRFSFAILSHNLSSKSFSNLESFYESLNITENNIENLSRVIRDFKSSVCLLFSGETTVKVRGKGKGGRNQELILAASIELEKALNAKHIEGEVILLSGGTDGIDGPTNSAGAVTFYKRKGKIIQLQTMEAKAQGLNPEIFLKENDSYEYFSRLSNGKYSLNIGQTGTNVMDIQLLMISRH